MTAALSAIHSHPEITVTAVSSLYETVAVGGPADQRDYLNAVAAIETTLSPETLLRFTQSIETELGRRRTTPNAPRTIDIDILLFGGLQSSSPIIPHPRMHVRAFVLRPLADIDSTLLHPVLNESVGTLLAKCDGGDDVRCIEGDGWWPSP